MAGGGARASMAAMARRPTPPDPPAPEPIQPRPVAKVDPDVLPIWPDTGRPGGEAAMGLAHDHPDYEFPKEVHNMLVSALAAHVALSAMADTKASILMGATFLVFTLTIGQMATATLASSYPLLVLGAFAFAATVLSVMAVMPKIKIPEGPQSQLAVLRRVHHRAAGAVRRSHPWAVAERRGDLPCDGA